MEQLNHLCGRLLGKKCVAVILGLLGLCGPSSLWAEKLDTTFVLDMVIDTTPCYYTKYDNKGTIVLQGKQYISYDFFRINIGYVTNEKGERIDTLYYGCNRVTKQWTETDYRTISGYRSEYSSKATFHSNGMLESIKEEDLYNEYVRFDDHILFTSEGYFFEDISEHTTYDRSYYFNGDKDKYDNNGNLSYQCTSYNSWHTGGEGWNNGDGKTEHIYDNEYMSGNLVKTIETIKIRKTDYYDESTTVKSEYESEERHMTVHVYDDKDRRIKTMTYDSTSSGYILTDSTIYTYGHLPQHSGEPFILSMVCNGKVLSGLTNDKFFYDYSDSIIYNESEYKYDKLEIHVPYGTRSQESFDKETNTMTIIVKGSNYKQDSTDMNTYTIVFAGLESYLTALYINDVPVKEFSRNKFEYDLMDSTVNDWSIIDYRISPGATIEEHYSTTTNILTINVMGADYRKYQDTTNKHTYFIKCKKPGYYLTSLSINGIPVKGFSPDDFNYYFSDSTNYTNGLTVDYTTSSGAHVSKKGISFGKITISVEGEGVEDRNNMRHTYVITLNSGVYLTSISNNGEPLKDFQYDNYEYDLSNTSYYNDSDFSYTYSWQQQVRIGDEWFDLNDLIQISKNYDYQTNTLTIDVCEMCIYNGRKEVDERKTYHFKFKKPIVESFMTSLYLEETRIDSFSPDKYVYDFSDYYYYGVHTTRDKSNYISLSKFNDDSTGSNLYDLKWTSSDIEILSKKLTSTSHVSYEKETGIIYITIEGDNYEDTTNNTHVYKILTKKVDSVVAYSFELRDYHRKWDFDIKGNSNEHRYEKFATSIYEDAYNTDSILMKIKANIPDNLIRSKCNYSDSTHTLTYIFYYRHNESLADTYYVDIRPCVFAIYPETNIYYEAVDKLEHYVFTEYRPDFSYTRQTYVSVTESYDDSTQTLTLIARYRTGDTTSKTEYHIHFMPPLISSVTINGEPLYFFSADKYDYKFDLEYNPNRISYVPSIGVTATESFDDSTNILTVRLTSNDIPRTVEYRFHFRPADGVDDFLGDQVSLYVTDKTICVDGATEPIYVYNLLGTLVGTGRGEEIRIPMAQAGVYVVKTGGKAAKVVVR